MRVTKTVGNLTLDINAETQKEVFKELATFEEVFGESSCGKCNSDNLRFVVRENDGNEYYELRCQSCGARLSFGSHKKGGGLFPRRKDSDNNYLPDKGWQKWNPKTKSLE